MSNLDLHAIKARYQAATEGPWEADDCIGDSDRGQTNWICIWGPGGHGMGRVAMLYDDNCDEEELRANAEFSAHARTDIPALVEEVERLNGQLALSQSSFELAEGQSQRARRELVRTATDAVSIRELKQERDNLRAALEKAKEGIDTLQGMIDLADKSSFTFIDELRAEIEKREQGGE